jgi:hypothetical protein
MIALITRATKVGPTADPNQAVASQARNLPFRRQPASHSRGPADSGRRSPFDYPPRRPGSTSTQRRTIWFTSLSAFAVHWPLAMRSHSSSTSPNVFASDTAIVSGFCRRAFLAGCGRDDAVLLDSVDFGLVLASSCSNRVARWVGFAPFRRRAGGNSIRISRFHTLSTLWFRRRSTDPLPMLADTLLE